MLLDKTKTPDASIVIVCYNSEELIVENLRSVLEKTKYLDIEVIVVDNGSKDKTYTIIEEQFPEVILVQTKKNLGFGGGNNLGFKRAGGRYVVLLNTDAFLHDDALNRAIAHMDANPYVGLSGGKLIGRQGEWQPSARAFPSLVNDFFVLSGLSSKYPSSPLFGRVDNTYRELDEPTEVDWIPGAFSIIRKNILDSIDGFDERFYLYYEEVDLCRRIKEAGHSIMYWPDVVVTHIGGETTKKNPGDNSFSKKGAQVISWRMRSELLYYRKHHGLFGAYSRKMIESLWHRLRAWKNSSSDKEKTEESQEIPRLFQEAWCDTQGGRVSPPIPW